MHEIALTRHADTGHVMAQVAACQRAVGVATLPRPRLLDLRGRTADLTAAVWMLSDGGPAHPQPGQAGHGWWRAASAHRVLVLEDPASPGRLGAFLDGLATRHPDVTATDISDAHFGLVMAGRLARRLAESAAARLSEPAITVGDGEEYWLLVLRRERAGDARQVLLEMGRVDGAVSVGHQAAELYRAGRRARATRAQPSSPQPFSTTTTTGAPSA